MKQASNLRTYPCGTPGVQKEESDRAILTTHLMRLMEELRS